MPEEMAMQNYILFLDDVYACIWSMSCGLVKYGYI